MARKIAIRPAPDANVDSVKETGLSKRSAMSQAESAADPKQARPGVVKANSNAFAAELLISDRTVMDILSK